jgi:hypothetical protein
MSSWLPPLATAPECRCGSVRGSRPPPIRDLHNVPICVISYLRALATSGRRVSEVDLTRFSDAFGILATNDDDWFDLTIELDSNFGVDPFLIYQDDSSRWNTAHDHILKFFAVVFDCVRRADGNKNSLYWKIAEQLLLFREPAEFCLGVSAKTPFGAGAGQGLQRDMLESISVALAHGKDSIPHVEYIDVLAGGLGLDRISDMTCNILKSYFEGYSKPHVSEKKNSPRAASYASR